MRPLLTKITLIALFVCAHAGKVVAQHEFVALIDPATGTITKSDSIPGVMYIAPHAAFDDKNRRFLFIGQPPDQSTKSLFSIDVTTGKVVSKTLLPKSPTLISMRYGNASGILYGVTILSGVCDLISINTATGAYSTIKHLTMNSMAEEMIIDDRNHRIFMNCVEGGKFVLLSHDMSGNILFKTVVPNITGLQYDRNTDKLYGLHYNGTQQELIQVDASTGVQSKIADLPEIQGTIQYSTTYDEVQHRYFFGGSIKNGGSALFTIDVTNGKVIYQTPVPVSANSVDKDNVIQFRYSNSLNQLYALHWNGTKITNPPTVPSITETKIYYTPANRSIIINRASTDCSTRMNLYTSLGQTIIAGKTITDGFNQVRVPALATGVYLVKLFCGNTVLRSTKLFIAH